MLSARQIRDLLIGLALIGALLPTSSFAQRRLSYRRANAAVPSRLFENGAQGAPIKQLQATAAPRNVGEVRPAQVSSVEEMPSVTDDVQQLNEVIQGDEWVETGAMVDDGGHGQSCGCGSCKAWGPNVLPGSWVDHLSLFGGAHAFKNDANLGRDGSFGFHYGLNFGTAAKNIILPRSVGWQIGAQFANSNLNAASFTLDERNQIFVTAGLYRRGDHGLQGGLVFDYMWDNWYYDPEVNVGQVRGEVGLATTPLTSLGFEFAASMNDHTVLSRLIDGPEVNKWRTKDQFRFFYRTRMFGGGRGESQIYAGFSGHSDGIIGGKSKMPLHNGWALETDYTYLIPAESKRNGANENESWNIVLNLVWFPGSLHGGSCHRYHRPLFDVANNGSMILRRDVD